uniref:NADH-ubiquinone oxidoreductase chain 3 n=1 Tax=Coniopteryx sp. YW-2016 TaxID=1821761 RepID=A0A1S5QYC6_9NEOP|nr:NADH dehydrogenase subunit 3 [Coniopteryx sp. YW-2016]
MFFLLIIASVFFMLSLILMIISSTISKKSNFDFEKNSPFECGFDPKTSTRMPFSLHFFLIAIIFLIFDIEIALIFPIIVIMKSTNLMIFMKIMIFFILILLLGLYYEWAQGSLNWSF